MSLLYACKQYAAASAAAEAADNLGDLASDAAQERVARWCEAVSGMMTGELAVGSRAPLRGVSNSALPTFLTPDVLQGGFVSGRLKAGGALLPFEQRLADAAGATGSGDERVGRGVFAHALRFTYSASPDPGPTAGDAGGGARAHRSAAVRRIRREINLHFVSRAGIAFLRGLLRSRRYRVQCAEEAALLVVAWLVDRREGARATAIVRAIAPYFHLARFYPRPAAAPVELSLRCSRSTVGDVRKDLTIRAQGRVKNRAARYCVFKIVVDRLAPAYDALLSLVLATCEQLPSGQSDRAKQAAGATAPDQACGGEAVNAKMLLPFQKIPTAAMLSALRAVDAKFVQIERDVAEVRRGRPACKLKQLSASRNCGAVLAAARTFFVSHHRVNRAVRFVQTILRDIHAHPRRALPVPWNPAVNFAEVLSTGFAEDGGGAHAADAIRTPQLAAYRAAQRFAARAEAHYLSRAWASVQLARLEAADGGRGLDELAPLLAPCSRAESVRFHVRMGQEVPAEAVRALRLLQRGTVGELVERGAVPSMETLAALVGPLLGVAKTEASGGGEEFRALFGATAAAFRARRSLLLLNFEKQVGFNELPWAEPLERFRRANAGASSATLRELFVSFVRLCVLRWPHVMLPNKMVSALAELAAAAEIETPRGPWLGLTPELAADIFMGGFTTKWPAHAVVAKQQLAGSLYDLYFRDSSADASSIWSAVVPGNDDASMAAVERFCEPCGDGSAWSVAANGAYIERAMVFTTHNYAYLFETLAALGQPLSQTELRETAARCFEMLSAALAPVTKTDGNMPWQSKLQATKNVAYGWRQLVFLVSHLDKEGTDEFFRVTVSKDKAAAGCHLQRALIDLRGVWQVVQCADDGDKNVSRSRTRPWKPFYGWNIKGAHPMWSNRWCEEVKVGCGNRNICESEACDT